MGMGIERKVSTDPKKRNTPNHSCVIGAGELAVDGGDVAGLRGGGGGVETDLAGGGSFCGHCCGVLGLVRVGESSVGLVWFSCGELVGGVEGMAEERCGW